MLYTLRSLKKLFILIAIALYSCESSPETKSNAEKEASKDNKLESVGEKIQGDFNGDKQPEFAFATKLREQQGNPVEGGTSAEYQLQFSDTNLPHINIGCCDVRIINEGDLNTDGADELSLFLAPVNGCVYSMTTYSFKNGIWLQIIKPFIIMTDCDGVSNEELQNRIFTENKSIYYLDTDLNDENAALIKKKVIQ
jgi:hypothetical protein